MDAIITVFSPHPLLNLTPQRIVFWSFGCEGGWMRSLNPVYRNLSPALFDGGQFHQPVVKFSFLAVYCEKADVKIHLLAH